MDPDQKQHTIYMHQPHLLNKTLSNGNYQNKIFDMISSVALKGEGIAVVNGLDWSCAHLEKLFCNLPSVCVSRGTVDKLHRKIPKNLTEEHSNYCLVSVNHNV